MIQFQIQTENYSMYVRMYYPVYMEQNYLDRNLDFNLNCNLDLDPEDVPAYTRHSLFNTS